MHLTKRQLCALCVWVVAMGLWFVNRRSAKSDRDPIIARAFSSVALVHFAFLLIPVARNSFVLKWVGLSFERAVRYHRWLGRSTFILVTIHGILMSVRFGSDVLKAESLTGFPHPPVYGVVAWLLMASISGGQWVVSPV